jgi:CRISPR/Cas system-associated exonuclease Cas4 (RecB family)
LNLNDIFNGITDTVEYKKKNKLIPKLIEQMTLESKKTRPVAQEAKFRASGMGGCKRKMIYELMGYESEPDHVGAFTLEQGTLIHEMIQGYLQRAGVIESMEEELQILPELNGHYDGVINLNGERYLLEIKTINHIAYERVSKYNTVYKKYVIQAHCYMKALGLNKCLFLFVNKGHTVSEEFAQQNPDIDKLFHEIEVRFDNKIWGEIESKVSELKEYFSSKTLPPMKKVSECSYCTFQNKCYSDWESEKIAKKAEKPKQQRTRKNKL